MPDPVSSWEVFKWTWENRREIRKLLTGVYDWFRGKGRNDKRGILVIGPGGSGKTTLALILSGEFDWLTSAPWTYTESRGLESHTLKDDKRVEVVVPPGQKHRREAYWTNILADLAAGKYRGVILLTAYGYHTLSATTSYKTHPLYTKGKAAFMDAYLQECREDEIRILQRLVPQIQVCARPVWLLTLVTKQDLWCRELTTVEQHYRSGEYGDEIAKLSASKDGRSFRHELVLASLVIGNFETSVGERLQANTKGYDQQAQVESIHRLIETVAALKTWEAEK